MLKKNRFFIIIWTSLLCVMMLSISAQACYDCYCDEDYGARGKYNGFYYTYSWWYLYEHTGESYVEPSGNPEATVRIVHYKGKDKKLNVPQYINVGDNYGELPVVFLDMFEVKNVEELYVPNGIEIYNLSNAPKLKKIKVDSKNKKYAVKNNLLLNKAKNQLVGVPGGIKKVNIPGSVVTIRKDSFSYSNAEEIKLGKKTRKFSSAEFYNCKKMKKFIFNDVIEKIPSRAFEKCSRLKKIALPENVKKIGPGAFGECKSLKQVTIKNKNCKIISSKKLVSEGFDKEPERTIPKHATIVAHKNSLAHKYALKNGNKFVAIG